MNKKTLESQIPPLIREKLGVPVKRLERIPTGLFNHTYILSFEKPIKVVNSQPFHSDKLVIRIAPPPDAGLLFYEKDMMHQEPQIHQIIQAQTSIPVPTIYVHDFSREMIARDYLLMEYLEGTALSQAYWMNISQRKKVFRKVGEYLQEAHAITSPQYGYLGAHQPMEPQATWWEAFKIMWNKMIEDIHHTGLYSEEESRKFRALLAESKAHFAPRSEIPASLLHMDIWAQNILVNRQGEVTGIVDWDRALWGDPEIEYAVLDYCGVTGEAFWAGYGLRRPQNRSRQVRDLFYLLYEHQKYIPIHIWRRKNQSRALAYKKDCLSLLSQLSKLI
mgnify:CR=1 FL=1